MTEDQIKHMVNRFLGFKLPDNFRPDGGISFQALGNEGTEHQYKRQPTGTNVLDATQAEAMVRHMVDGLPSDQKEAIDLNLTDAQRQCLQWYADNQDVPSPEGRRVPSDHKWNTRQLNWALDHQLLHVGPNGWHVPTGVGHLALMK